MVLVHSFIMWRCQVSAEKKTFGSTQPVAGHFRKKKEIDWYWQAAGLYSLYTRLICKHYNVWL